MRVLPAFLTMLLAAPLGAATRILVLGDSITEGSGLSRDHAFPARVEEALRREGREVSVINAGVSGSTTDSGPSRMVEALKHQPRPDLIVVALGGNDGLQRADPNRIEKNLVRTLSLAAAAGEPVLLAGLKAPASYDMGDGYVQAFVASFVNAAKRFDVRLIPSFLDKVAGDPNLNLQDGIHPNDRGQAIIAETVLPYIREALDSKPPAAHKTRPKVRGAGFTKRF